ncbi:hypothetical protein SAMN05421676_11083 [Salinibacillus kushneri]|uniref:Uncharacterized protein n=1 Tax=Salinibacillus kushneri TaxID=237682 RepID=A0A1I0I2F8_9BACI|nr:hypothetical protein [Salinibacillus kushneri]SET89959.1 hypothetical protein SAMN05421676_11083 [Salinibacillus kushneri]
MKIWLAILSFVVIVFLSGCLYPEEELKKNQVPDDMQLEMVQEAVTNYKNDHNGQLPIKTRDAGTPIFIKYPINFKTLKQNGYLSSTPGNAFEQGGHYQYVIIHPETKATVKLVDLRLSETLRELSFKLEVYRNEHIYPPFGEDVASGLYKIDIDKLGLEQPPVVKSPYTGQNLPIYMDTNGELVIDYRKDLYQVIQEYEHDYKTGDDIRYLLAEHYPFVPAYSMPFTIQDDEPVFQSTVNDEKNDNNS